MIRRVSLIGFALLAAGCDRKADPAVAASDEAVAAAARRAVADTNAAAVEATANPTAQSTE